MLNQLYIMNMSFSVYQKVGDRGFSPATTRKIFERKKGIDLSCGAYVNRKRRLVRKGS